MLYDHHEKTCHSHVLLCTLYEGTCNLVFVRFKEYRVSLRGQNDGTERSTEGNKLIRLNYQNKVWSIR